MEFHKKIQPVPHIFDELRLSGPTLCVWALWAAVLGSFWGVANEDRKASWLCPGFFRPNRVCGPFWSEFCGTLEQGPDRNLKAANKHMMCIYCTIYYIYYNKYIYTQLPYIQYPLA